MRIIVFSLLGLLLVAASASAQQAENLDTVLRGWEKGMTDLKSFVSEVQRVTEDKALGAKDEHKGYAMFMKPAAKDDGSRARLELAKVGNPKIFERYICTGIYLYEYALANNTIRVHDMPRNKKDGVQQESFLSFLFGMGAEDAKRRYDMKLVYPKDKDGKEVIDPNYHYIQIVPKLDQDKGDFIQARLSLYRTNNLPAQIWYLQPNKNEITWTFTKLQLNVQIPLTYFQPEDLKGWRTEVVRPKTPEKLTPTIRN